MQRSRGAVGVVCAVVAVALVAAPAAAGSYKKGRYEGTTEQACGPPGAAGPCPISFKAKKRVVKKFSFTAVMTCDDGVELQVPHMGATAPTTKKGKFKATFLIDDARIEGTQVRLNGETVVTGKLKRRRGSGHLEGEATRTDGPSCSASTTWTAQKP